MHLHGHILSGWPLNGTKSYLLNCLIQTEQGCELDITCEVILRAIKSTLAIKKPLGKATFSSDVLNI